MSNNITQSIDERRIAWLTLNKVERHNAFDDVLIGELTDSIRRLNDNPDVRIIVLAANGKSFSAGADLEWMKRSANYTEAENLSDAQALGELMNSLYTCSKPTVARVQGSAFGGGVGLIACCDIALAVESAKFCLSEVRLGLVPAVISPYLVAAMGSRVTKRLTLTAERFPAFDAVRYNLIHGVVDDQPQLDDAVERACDNLLLGAPNAQMAGKTLISSLHHRSIDSAMIEETAQLIARIRTGNEGREGVSAFLQKRKPRWVESEND